MLIFEPKMEPKSTSKSMKFETEIELGKKLEKRRKNIELAVGPAECAELISKISMIPEDIGRNVSRVLYAMLPA